LLQTMFIISIFLVIGSVLTAKLHVPSIDNVCTYDSLDQCVILKKWSALHD
jgi:hypothetical protein